MGITDSIEVKTSKAKKMMLWFGLISITMTFAGLTSAFIVSSSRPDWLDSFVLPVWFTISTVSIALSSVFFQLAKYRLDQYVRVSLPENINIYLHRNNVNLFLGLTILMAIVFIIAQFLGFGDIKDKINFIINDNIFANINIKKFIIFSQCNFIYFF